MQQNRVFCSSSKEILIFQKSQSIMSYQQDLIRQLKAESTSEINKVAAEKESLEEKVKKMESELLALRSQLESSKTNADQK